MPLEKLFIPVSPFTYYYPLLQPGFSFWRCTDSRKEMAQGDLGTEIRDKFHCLDSATNASAFVLMHLCLKRSLPSLGSNHRAGSRAFPRAVGAADSSIGLSVGCKETRLFQAGDRSSDGLSPQDRYPTACACCGLCQGNSRGQTCPDLPSSGSFLPLLCWGCVGSCIPLGMEGPCKWTSRAARRCVVSQPGFLCLSDLCSLFMGRASLMSWSNQGKVSLFRVVAWQWEVSG